MYAGKETHRTKQGKLSFGRPPAKRTKKCVYGSDTPGFKAATKNVFMTEVHQWATNQFALTEPTGNTAAYEPVFGPNPPPTPSGGPTEWVEGAPFDFYAVDTEYYTQMTARSTAGSGFNSFRQLGARWAVSEEAPTLANPYVETYVAYKLDAQGFNGNKVTTFNEMCGRYQMVKQGPYSMTFYFSEPPMGNRPVVRQFPLASSGTNLGGVSRPTVEEHTIGVWEYIIIPPRDKASVKLTALLGTANWNRLVDMGFTCRKVGVNPVSIFCSNKGIDDQQMAFARRGAVVQGASNYVAATVSTTGSNTVSAADLERAVEGYTKKSSWHETEKSCQYGVVGQPLVTNDDSNAWSWPGQDVKSFDAVVAQGYGVYPFGAAVVFKFRQYAPPMQATAANPPVLTHTACRAVIPIEIHIDTFCKWKNTLVDQLDIDQLTTPYQSY